MPLSHATRLSLLALVALLAASVACAQNNPSTFDDLAAQAAAARDQQNVPLALDRYHQALQLKPDWIEGWWNVGLLHYVGRQCEPAIEAFNHLLQINPAFVPAIAIRGLCEFQTGAYEDSLRDLDRAVAHGAAGDTEHAAILRYHLGLLLTRDGRFWDALGQFRALASHDSGDPDLPIAIGMAGLRMQRLPQDLNAADRQLCAAVGQAAQESMTDSSDTADASFRDLFVHYPATPNLHYFYGLLLFSHDRGMAAEQFQQEVAVNPSNELARASLAFTLMYVGRYTEAVPVAEHALSAEPTMLMAQLALGRSLIETGNEKRGLELLHQVLDHDPNNIEAHLGLVAAYSREGRKEDAYRERMLCLQLRR